MNPELQNESLEMMNVRCAEKCLNLFLNNTAQMSEADRRDNLDYLAISDKHFKSAASSLFMSDIDDLDEQPAIIVKIAPNRGNRCQARSLRKVSRAIGWDVPVYYRQYFIL